MAKAYESMSEAARAHGVKPQAASKWRKHPKFPCSDGIFDKGKIDRFVEKWIKPHRKTPALNRPAAAVFKVEGNQEDDQSPPDLAKIGRQIRSASDAASADYALKQIRAYRLWCDEQTRQKLLVNADVVRRDLATILQHLKIELLALPPQLASTLAGVTADDAKTILEGRVTELLTGLKKAFERAAGS